MENLNITLENKEVKAAMFNFQEWIQITDSVVLKAEFNSLLELSGYKVLNFIEHVFPNGGYTCLWLLAESHLAIHTFIAEGKTYIELSGCNREMNRIFREEFSKKFN